MLSQGVQIMLKTEKLVRLESKMPPTPFTIMLFIRRNPISRRKGVGALQRFHSPVPHYRSRARRPNLTNQSVLVEAVGFDSTHFYLCTGAQT